MGYPTRIRVSHCVIEGTRSYALLIPRLDIWQTAIMHPVQILADAEDRIEKVPFVMAWPPIRQELNLQKADRSTSGCSYLH
jgi:hypothetical protein